MAILKIVQMGNPLLRMTSRKVDAVTPRIHRLLDDMTHTMREQNGCGLAAVQVGVLRRVVVIEAEEGKVIELINPEIISSQGKQNEYEGCLSAPGRYAITDRPMTVTVRAQNRDGKIFETTGSELLARAFCHEIDHLNGIMYIDNAIRILTEEELREMLEKD